MKNIEVVFQNDTIRWIEFEEIPRLGETILLDKEYIVTKVIHSKEYVDFIPQYKITKIEVI